MNLSARQIRAFLFLAEERHFTRAARRCHLTQPAFSALIQSLEELVGVRLFDRSTRRVTLTQEGEHFFLTAPRLLNDMEGLIGEMRQFADKRRGKVSIAALPSLAAGWLPGICATFSAQYPAVRISLRDALLEPCLQMVRDGAADMALAAQGLNMEGLTVDPLCEDRFYFICRHDHPLADHETVTTSDLTKERLIHLGKGSSIRQGLVSDSRIAEMPVSFEVDHLATVCGLVLAGMGVSLVPGMTLFHFRYPLLRAIPLAPGSEIRRQLLLVRREDRGLSAAAQAFHDLVMHERSSLASDGEFAIRVNP